jgi:hypothetical protein
MEKGADQVNLKRPLLCGKLHNTPTNMQIRFSLCFGAEQSWRGDFLFLARNSSWIIMQGRKTAKGPKKRIENKSYHYHQREAAVASC